MQIFASISVDFPMNQFVLQAKVCKSILRSWLGAIRQPVPMLTKLCVAIGYNWEVIGYMAPSYVTWWHKWALLRLWLVTWQHQAITWAIVAKSPVSIWHYLCDELTCTFIRHFFYAVSTMKAYTVLCNVVSMILTPIIMWRTPVNNWWPPDNHWRSPVIIWRPPVNNSRPPVIMWRPPVNNSRPPVIMWRTPVNNWWPPNNNWRPPVIIWKHPVNIWWSTDRLQRRHMRAMVTQITSESSVCSTVCLA